MSASITSTRMSCQQLRKSIIKHVLEVRTMTTSDEKAPAKYLRTLEVTPKMSHISNMSEVLRKFSTRVSVPNFHYLKRSFSVKMCIVVCQTFLKIAVKHICLA